MKITFFTSIFLLTLLTTSFAAEVYAQKEKPNFSGNWTFDKTESGAYLLGNRITELSKMIFNCSITMLVKHNEPELVVKATAICNEANKSVKTTETTSRYFTDEGGESNILSGETVESKTKWDGNKIIITKYQVNAKSGKKKAISAKEISLSKNRQKLTEKLAEVENTLSSASMYGDSYRKRVFKISK